MTMLDKFMEINNLIKKNKKNPNLVDMYNIFKKRRALIGEIKKKTYFTKDDLLMFGYMIEYEANNLENVNLFPEGISIRYYIGKIPLYKYTYTGNNIDLEINCSNATDLIDIKLTFNKADPNNKTNAILYEIDRIPNDNDNNERTYDIFRLIKESIIYCINEAIKYDAKYMGDNNVN